MTTKTAINVYEDVFENIRKASEAGMKMQQDMMQQWTKLWPGMPAPQTMWVDKMRDFQKKWAQTVSEIAHEHRATFDRQYEAALESLEEAMKVLESSNPDELRERTEQVCRKSLDCVKQVSEAQMQEFQGAMSKWGELFSKANA
jgi:hypothetical protein